MYELIAGLVAMIILDKTIHSPKLRKWLGLLLIAAGLASLFSHYTLVWCSQLDAFWPLMILFSGWQLFDKRNRYIE
ncbi:hypothetical protein [Pseudomonas putida]|uniref:hypothetical protein n=1 Tax=Pseudomonas putida TaxID=303 RepID=UPI0011470B04|nr:hypothetical protein [Pseudomonas putida]